MQFLSSEDEEEEEIEEDFSVSEAEDSELLTASSLSELPKTSHTDTQEHQTGDRHGTKRDKEETGDHTTSEEDVETDEHPLHLKLESQHTRRKGKKKSRGGLNLRRSHRVAPLPYTPVNITSTPQHRAPHQASGHIGLGWMDTVNGPQLMSMQPILASPPLQFPPPQYVLPAQAMVSPLSPSHYPYHPPPLPHTPTNTHPFTHYTPRKQRASKQPPRSGKTGRRSRKERDHLEIGADTVDGVVQPDSGDHHVDRKNENENENEKVVSTYNVTHRESGKDEREEDPVPTNKDKKDEGKDPDFTDASHKGEQLENADHDTKSAAGVEKKKKDDRATDHSVQELLEQVMHD